MPCDRRHSPTVRSCQELARIGRKHNRSCRCLSSARYVDGIKVLAEQFNQSVLAMVRKAAERVSPAETWGNRRRRRDACRRFAQRYQETPAVDQAVSTPNMTAWRRDDEKVSTAGLSALCCVHCQRQYGAPRSYVVRLGRVSQ
jgi:hypothetical protein